MIRALLALAALLTLTGCSATARVKATPLREQDAAQIKADRQRCEAWAKTTASVSVGYAACMIAAGYAATPEVPATSQPVRLTRTPPKNEPINVMIDLLDCDSQGQREAEAKFGLVRSLIREHLGWTWGTAAKRRQVFVDCLKPRGYEIGKG